MSTWFKGLRIDNAHSTPKHVLRYLIKWARKVNKNIIIIAELFTGN